MCMCMFVFFLIVPGLVHHKADCKEATAHLLLRSDVDLTCQTADGETVAHGVFVQSRCQPLVLHWANMMVPPHSSSFVRPLSFSVTHTRTHSHTPSHTRTHSHTPSHTLTHTHTHTHTLTRSLSHTHSLSLTYTHALYLATPAPSHPLEELKRSFYSGLSELMHPALCHTLEFFVKSALPNPITTTTADQRSSTEASDNSV